MKIATDANGCGMSVGGNEFKESVSKLISERQPQKIIETGTFLGTGTTKIILDSLDSLGKEYKMFSIEVNPDYYKKACENLIGRNIKIINGLSIPAKLLPTEQQTESWIESLKEKDIFVDHQEKDRITLYNKECDFEVPNNCLEVCMSIFNYEPDLLVLDSAGHVGYIEFQYVRSLLNKPCIFILDDVYHIKHNKSLEFMLQNEDRFKIIKLSSEKFGFVIAEYKGL